MEFTEFFIFFLFFEKYLLFTLQKNKKNKKDMLCKKKLYFPKQIKKYKIFFIL
jgi:hypothetical protein